MYRLVTLPPAFGMRNVSPFCVKTELLMTSLGIDFECDPQPDPRKAPKGKMPYLVTVDGVIADSDLIAEYLDGVTEGAVYAGMTPRQRGIGLAATRLAEEHLYWLIVESRWGDDAFFPHIVRDFFGFVPGLIRGFASGAARREVLKTIDLQGLGRHSPQEKEGFARRDLQALADLLPETGFLGGEAPRLHDFAVTGILTSILDQQPHTWINAIADEFPSLSGYAERVQASVGVWARQDP